MAGLTPQVEIANQPAVPFAGLTLDLDITLIFIWVLFLIPLIVLNGLIFGPFLKVFEERHDRVYAATERAEQKLELAEQKAQSFQEQIKIASTKGIEIRDKIRAEATAKMNERLSAEREKLDKKLQDALKEINFAREMAISETQGEARQLAEITAKKLLGRG